MNIAQVMVVLNDDLKNMMFPQCNSFEKVVVGISLAGLTYKVGQLVSENSALISKLLIVDNDGNVDIAALEYAVLNGIPWPLAVGPFNFSKSDFEKIFNHLKENKQ